jgi:tetratricopeptide (TPR) repeat protein
MSDWRNAGLAEAESLCGAWACMLDTDVRIKANGVDIRKALAETKADVLNILEDTGLYMKELFFRLPTARYSAAYHERFDCKAAGVFNTVRFHELAKTPEHIKARLLRDLEGLGQQILEEPKESRWVYYLGTTYENLHEPQNAIKAYIQCATMSGPAEERAWACFRAASCWVELGLREYAIQECIKGMAICPGMVELPWFAGVQCLALGRPFDAIYWANMASTLGYGSLASSRRLGFRAPQAWFEGCAEVLEPAYRILGNKTASEIMKKEIERLRIERVKWQEGAA